MIDRFEPFGRATSLRQMMDRMLEDAYVMPPEGGAGSRGGPALDIYEEGDTLVVEAHVPGVKPEDLDVQVEQGELTISGQSRSEEERKERNYLIREQRTGRFARSLQLPSRYNADACRAEFDNGVLRLVFPMADEAKPRRIQISGGGQRTIEGQKVGASR